MNLYNIVEQYFDTHPKPVQLVLHYDEVTAGARKNMQWPALCQVKEDGVYALVVQERKADVPRIYTRTGKRMYLPDAAALRLVEVAGLQASDSYAFIAELVCPGLSLEELSGLVNPNRVEPWPNDMLCTMLEYGSLRFHDAVSVSVFYSAVPAKCLLDYSDRLDVLRRRVDRSAVVQGRLVYTEEQWEETAQQYIDEGYEGAVLKQLHADWEAGHKGWRCTKRVRGIHLDLRCTGWALGKGKRSGQVAKLHFEYKGKPFSADLGKGWTDDKRIALTARATGLNDDVTGKVFHVKGLQVSSKGVIRLPKVQEERIDKTEQDNWHVRP